MADAIDAQAMRCPACSAPVETPPGDVLRCPYCGIKSRVNRLAQAHAAAGAPPRRAGSGGAALVSVAVVVLGLGGAAYFMLLSAGSDSAAVHPAKPAAVTRSIEAPTPAVVPAPPEVAPAPSEPDAYTRRLDERLGRSDAPAPGAIAVRWTAKVKKASGRSKRGVKCEIVGHVDGDSVRPLDLRCKGDLLYSSTQKFSGMANMSTGATVVTAKDGSPRWHLRYNDTGSRSNRPQIRLDSAARMGRVWSDELPPFDVELAIDPEGKPAPAASAPQ